MKKIVYLVATVVLGLVGIGLLWGGVYATNFVKDNLSEQRITFPEASALEARGDTEFLEYAGELVDTGKEAKAYSEYIQGHVAKIAGGQTYAEVSGQYNALSDEDKQGAEGQKLAGQRQSIFMGEMLRGTLLNAYGWGFVGQVATLAGAGLVIAAGIFAILLSLSNLSEPKAKKAAKKSSAKRRR